MNEMNNQSDRGSIPWQPCPSSEIELRKSERFQISKAHSKLLAEWEKEKHQTDDFVLARENNKGLAEAADQLNRLQSEITSAEDQTNKFLSDALMLMQPMLSPNHIPTTVRSQETAFIQGLMLMTGMIHALNKKLYAEDELMKETIEALDSVITFFPDIKDDYGNILQQDVMTVLLHIATGSKAMHCTGTKLREAEADLIKSRELKGAREEKLSKETQKLEFELDNARHELELDNKAITKDLESKCAKIERQKEQLKKFRGEFMEVRKERDGSDLDNYSMALIPRRKRRSSGRMSKS
jgi:hypothetical protein